MLTQPYQGLMLIVLTIQQHKSQANYEKVTPLKTRNDKKVAAGVNSQRLCSGDSGQLNLLHPPLAPVSWQQERIRVGSGWAGILQEQEGEVLGRSSTPRDLIPSSQTGTASQESLQTYAGKRAAIGPRKAIGDQAA